MTTPIDTTSLPASVQAGTPQDQSLYETSLQFEQILTEQLTQELDPSSQDDGSDGSDSDSGDAGYGQMLPGALAQSVTDGGGLGLANELFLSLKQSQGQSA